MTTVVIVDNLFGDSGKGRFVDYLSKKAKMVVRSGSGPNAGHTLVVNGKKTVLRQIPSGILHSHTKCVLAQGMALNPNVFSDEVSKLVEAGVKVNDRIFVSDAAHLIMPYHIEEDKKREEFSENKIGTTKNGVGPCYEDKMARCGFRIGELSDLDTIMNKVRMVLKRKTTVYDYTLLASYLHLAAKTFLPFVTDTSKLINQAIDSKDDVLFENAQGTLLDIDHGTYPFVTSSSAVAGGVCTGAGVGPTRINKVIGVMKAYNTRVGSGPLPGEFQGETADKIAEIGNEVGSVTGRARRIGWLDINSLRYAHRVNHFDSLAMAKFDVLTGLPVSIINENNALITFEPWHEDISKIREYNQLPKNLCKFIEYIEQSVGVRVSIVSVGPEREQTILREEIF